MDKQRGRVEEQKKLSHTLFSVISDPIRGRPGHMWSQIQRGLFDEGDGFDGVVQEEGGERASNMWRTCGLNSL